MPAMISSSRCPGIPNQPNGVNMATLSHVGRGVVSKAHLQAAKAGGAQKGGA